MKLSIIECSEHASTMLPPPPAPNEGCERNMAPPAEDIGLRLGVYTYVPCGAGVEWLIDPDSDRSWRACGMHATEALLDGCEGEQIDRDAADRAKQRQRISGVYRACRNALILVYQYRAESIAAGQDWHADRRVRDCIFEVLVCRASIRALREAGHARS